MTNLRLRSVLVALTCVATLAGCGGRAYLFEAVDVAGFRERAEIQADGPIRVAAAVPGRKQTQAIFGVDLYDQGIQPVWLEIENSGNVQARYALVSTDRFYFSPLEVAYLHRRGFSNEARAEMERHFHDLGMPRYVDPGETRSGFVFTHADTGAKGFNVDLFSSDASYHFTFLLRVPGFVPDYANIDFQSIYRDDELALYHGDELYEAVKALPCCSSDSAGNATEATLNVILVGEGRDLLEVLLRSRWVETAAVEAADEEPDFMFGRQQDAIFRYESVVDDSMYELRLWLAPMLHGDRRVWVGQVRHFYTIGGSFQRVDPDVDNARNFALQNLLYGQALEKLAWVSGDVVVPVDSFWSNLLGPAFFTDGHRVVLWLSAEPFSILDVTNADWDDPPGYVK